MPDGRTEAVARCLAQIDGRFVSAADWCGAAGDEYRRRAARCVADLASAPPRVRETLRRYDAGQRSGGL